jgi:predicted metal-dependent enzyme (double-stranded beta helix superfamily)
VASVVRLCLSLRKPNASTKILEAGVAPQTIHHCVYPVETKRSTIHLAVQQIVFQPGGQSGSHSHPGPVFIQVVSGTMTFYESDDPNCTPTIRSAGQGFLDVGENAHIARNETGSTATNVVTYLAPPGAALRIDQPNRGNCPF